jgi:hypothetical protein
MDESMGALVFAIGGFGGCLRSGNDYGYGPCQEYAGAFRRVMARMDGGKRVFIADEDAKFDGCA